MTDNELIGKRIKELREELEIKQESLASDIGIERPALSNYEIGRRTIPFDILKKVAKQLKTSTDYLLGLTESKSENIKDRVICNRIGLSDKCIEILKTAKNLDIINTINFLIEQEEILLYDGFSPIVHKKCNEEEYKKALKKATQEYQKEIEHIENNCIPIISNMHNYFNVKNAEENVYIINGIAKRISDFDYRADRYLADETIDMNDIIESTFFKKIENKLMKAKIKYLKRRNNKS